MSDPVRWVLSHHPDPAVDCIYVDDAADDYRYGKIASLYCQAGTKNPYLVVAAPELLEALVDVRDTIKDAHDHGFDHEHCARILAASKIISAAIAKAEAR